MNFAGSRLGTELRRAGFSREVRRFADERRPVGATELQCLAGLDTITLRAMFHGLSSCGV